MACTFIIWKKVTPFFRKEKVTSNCGNKDGNKINVLKNCIYTSVATVLCKQKLLFWMRLIAINLFDRTTTYIINTKHVNYIF